MQLLLVASFVLTGLLFIGISIPLIMRKIPPNPLYGFRVRKTMENPDIWYPANEYSGKLLAIAGAVIVLASIVIGAFRMPDLIYSIVMTVTMVICVTIALIASLIYLSKL